MRGGEDPPLADQRSAAEVAAAASDGHQPGELPAQRSLTADNARVHAAHHTAHHAAHQPAAHPAAHPAPLVAARHVRHWKEKKRTRITLMASHCVTLLYTLPALLIRRAEQSPQLLTTGISIRTELEKHSISLLTPIPKQGKFKRTNTLLFSTSITHPDTTFYFKYRTAKFLFLLTVYINLISLTPIDVEFESGATTPTPNPECAPAHQVQGYLW